MYARTALILLSLSCFLSEAPSQSNREGRSAARQRNLPNRESLEDQVRRISAARSDREIGTCLNVEWKITSNAVELLGAFRRDPDQNGLIELALASFRLEGEDSEVEDFATFVMESDEGWASFWLTLPQPEDNELLSYVLVANYRRTLSGPSLKTEHCRPMLVSVGR